MAEGPSDRESFGSWVRRQRENAGLTQEELAERSGLSARTIGNLERDRSRKPYPRSVRLVASALGLAEMAGDELSIRHWASRTAGSGLSRQLSANTDGLLRTSPDLEQGRAGHAPVVVPRQLSAKPRHFVGRRAELESLARLLDTAERAANAVLISAIGGMPGVGKTALAVHWAHQVADQFPDGQLFVNLRGFDPAGVPVSPTAALRDLLDALGVPAERIPPGLDARAGLYRSLLSGKRMLVVLDNARNAGQVRPLLPGSPGCMTIVTSRNTLTSLVAVEGANPLSLDVLDEEQAAELLAHRLGPDRVAAQPDAAAAITGLCAGLPLALVIAAARAVTQPARPLAQLASELADSHHRLSALDTADATASVHAAFAWSARQLTGAAARMLRLLAVHPGPDITIPATASLAGIPAAQARAGLAELTRAHLVAEHLPGRYSLHDLLRIYAAAEASKPGHRSERTAAIGRMLDHYLHTAWPAARLIGPGKDLHAPGRPRRGVTPEPITSQEGAMAWFHAERRVLLALPRLAEDTRSDRHALQIPQAMAVFLNRQGHWNDWIDSQRYALAAAARLGDLSGQAYACRDLGIACTQAGEHADAQTHLAAALDLFCQAKDPIGQARTHQALSLLLDQQGRQADALAHDRQALSLYTRAGHLAGRAHALNAVGWLLAQLGRHQQAIQHCQQALELSRSVGNRRAEAAALDSLGYASHHLGLHLQAVAYYQQSLNLFRSQGDLCSQAEVLTHLGDSHHVTGRHAAARDAWLHAFAILTDLNHPAAHQIHAKLASSPVPVDLR